MATLSGGTVSIPVGPDTEGFGNKLSQGILGQAGLFSGLGAHLGGLILGGIAVAGIGAGIGKIFSTGFQEAQDASAGIAQLNAGITSTGNAANVSVKSLTDLASSIQAYSGQTDDSIVKSEQLLLTFTNIRNVGPDRIFDQAAEAAANMAAKLGGDAASQSIVLGKALQDPIAGLTSLRRVGVAFTDSQKETITALVKTGDVVGAQKVILSELNTEFGGAAKAAGESLPGQLARTKRAFEDISQSIVESFLPIVTPAITSIRDALVGATPAITAFSQEFAVKLTSAIQTAKPVFDGIRDGLSAFGGFLSSTVIPEILSFGESFKPVFAAIGQAFKDLGPTFASLLPQVLELAKSVSPLQIVFSSLAPVIPEIVTVLGQLAATVTGALGQALVSILPAIQSVAQILAQTLGETIKTLVPVISEIAQALGPILGSVIQALAPIIGQLAVFLGTLITALAPILDLLSPLISAFLELISPLLQLVGAILTPLIQLLSAILTPVIAIITTVVNLLLPVLKAQIQIITFVIEVIVNVITWISNLVAWYINLSAQNTDLNKLISDSWNQISAAIGGAVDFISGTINFLGSVYTSIWQNAIQPALSGIGNAWNFLWSGIIQPISDFINGAINTIGSVISSVFGSIGGIIQGAFGGVVDYIRGVFNTIGDLINGVIDGINTVAQAASSIGINIGTVGRVPRLADGGTILPRPGGTLAVIAEGGRAESVVDTGKLNALIEKATAGTRTSGPSIVNNIYEAVSAQATAYQVSRMQAARGI